MEFVSSSLDYTAFLARAEFGSCDETVDHANRQIYRSYGSQPSAQVPADIFRLRHDIYCVECAFLSPDDYADGMEFDDYDDCAMHFAAYTMNETLIGTVRLVRPPNSSPFPFERHCTTFGDFTMPPRELCGEVSRLAVRRTHRRRRADSVIGIPGLSPAPLTADMSPDAAIERREPSSPMLLLGMYREMYRHSRQGGVRYWFAAMERSLVWSLARMGFRFEPIGPVADYYGAVTPHMLDLSRLSEQLGASNPALAAWFDEKPFVFAARRASPMRITPASLSDLDVDVPATVSPTHPEHAVRNPLAGNAARVHSGATRRLYA